MSLRTPTVRALRSAPRYISQPQLSSSSRCRHLTTSRRTLSPGRSLSEEGKEPLDAVTLHRLEAARRAYYKRRSYYAGVGFVLGLVGIYVTATWAPLPGKTEKMDSGRQNDPLVVLGKERKVVIQKLGEEPEEIPDVVETGTSTVPTFPRVVEFFDDESGVIRQDDPGMVEYQLMGLGIRTVSFLGVQVYVVGMYIATEDIAVLQKVLIRKIDPTATTLVAGEKEKLRDLLLDPVTGEEVWSQILKESGVRTLVRIVPTRNTDFHHLRDAWVRSITARAQRNKEEFGDEAFGAAVSHFKTLFNRGSVPKQKELLLLRDVKGKLAVWYDDGKSGAQRVGAVDDERISRGLWLNYLGGKTVASEPARQSIISGIMEFVERPIGTVATQVHEVNV
ncbi:hypothetical protein BP6252_07754 [Coleophoma cylindrospora]|uniref:Chalcone isomerase domain-containing protein n=1 Tax=Coleophoma cylindrospora TaxID=1849047 RepID=A0A3D8RBD4_9HELO|nr:hypothetical protein BP6252_07754 [Coleophoma cylindrospora]